MYPHSIFVEILIILMVTHSLLSNTLSIDVGTRKGTPIRVVTDVKSVQSKYGVPVLYWYNETDFDSESALSSVRGCPHSIDGMPWLYYGTPPRCFLTGTRGPCGPVSAIFPQWGSPYGVCGCLCLVDPGYKPEDIVESERYIHCKNVPVSYPYLSRHGQVYDKETEMCFNLFERGPCNETSVITEVNGTIACLPDCAKLGICNDHCEEEEASGVCALEPVLIGARPAMFHVRKLDCPKNQRFSSTLQKCVQKFISMGNFALG